MTTDRDALRRDLRARRRTLAPAQRVAAAERLADGLLALPFAPQAGYVAGYWAMDGEIGLHAWQLRLPRTVTYCLPVLHAGKRLRFAPWRPGETLVANCFGIPEPGVDAASLLEAQAMAMVVLPLVGFDATGQRLGSGGGWYDRSFAFRRTHAAPPWLVGAAFSLQQLGALDTQPWDVPLDAVCSDARTYLTPGPPA